MLLYPPNQNEIQNSLDHLHSKMHLIHTDIKPENILLVDNNTDEEDVRIKIIDMGSAVFGRAHDDDDNGSSGDSGGLKTSIVNTRQYRSPEILLRTGWSYPSDVWAAGKHQLYRPNQLSKQLHAVALRCVTAFVDRSLIPGSFPTIILQDVQSLSSPLVVYSFQQRAQSSTLQ
jgi:serine/threonine protein kinase